MDLSALRAAALQSKKRKRDPSPVLIVTEVAAVVAKQENEAEVDVEPGELEVIELEEGEISDHEPVSPKSADAEERTGSANGMAGADGYDEDTGDMASSDYAAAPYYYPPLSGPSAEAHALVTQLISYGVPPDYLLSYGIPYDLLLTTFSRLGLPLPPRPKAPPPAPPPPQLPLIDALFPAPTPQDPAPPTFHPLPPRPPPSERLPPAEPPSALIPPESKSSSATPARQASPAVGFSADPATLAALESQKRSELLARKQALADRNAGAAQSFEANLQAELGSLLQAAKAAATDDAMDLDPYEEGEEKEEALPPKHSYDDMPISSSIRIGERSAAPAANGRPHRRPVAMDFDQDASVAAAPRRRPFGFEIVQRPQKLVIDLSDTEDEADDSEDEEADKNPPIPIIGPPPALQRSLSSTARALPPTSTSAATEARVPSLPTPLPSVLTQEKVLTSPLPASTSATPALTALQLKELEIARMKEMIERKRAKKATTAPKQLQATASAPAAEAMVVDPLPATSVEEAVDIVHQLEAEKQQILEDATIEDKQPSSDPVVDSTLTEKADASAEVVSTAVQGAAGEIGDDAMHDEAVGETTAPFDRYHSPFERFARLRSQPLPSSAFVSPHGAEAANLEEGLMWKRAQRSFNALRKGKSAAIVLGDTDVRLCEAESKGGVCHLSTCHATHFRDFDPTEDETTDFLSTLGHHLPAEGQAVFRRFVQLALQRPVPSSAIESISSE